MSTSPPARMPPHIRLNSAQEDLLTNDSLLNQQSRAQRTPSSRSLTPNQNLTPLQTRNPYGASLNQSTEHLLPPSRSRSHRLRDEEAPLSPQSVSSSRRSSWDSERSRDFDNPFDDSRSVSRASSDEDVNTQTVSEKYNIMPDAGLLLFPEDVEVDDYLHNPSPDDNKRDCNIWTGRGAANLGGLSFFVVGMLFLFIGYPVLTFTNLLGTDDSCSGEADCLNVGTVSLLTNIRTSLIDPDTPDSAKTKTSYDGSTWELVFSDEFSTSGRSFYPDDDPYFLAMDLWYGATEDLEYYDPDAVTTSDGVLEIRFDAYQNHDLNYRSGMVQSWNQLCFKGGRLEASISLPGAGDTVGFWPGFWMMGNLGRPGYQATTAGMWPYSYHDECDAGITANQSSTDGINWLPGMKLPACTCSGADHPSPGRSRSAPEIDVFEATNSYISDGSMVGQVSQSLQMAPFDIWYQPDYNFTAVPDRSISSMNSYKGGPYQQAMSCLTFLNNDWYDGKEYQVYAAEYTPGTSGDITWYVGEPYSWHLTADAIGPNGNIGQRPIPEEPMAIIMNLGMSSGFSSINFTGIASLLPAKMRFDYIRIYQDSSSKSVTCDPDGWETTSYISDHSKAYEDYNITDWTDAGYDWPKNSYVDTC